MNLGLLDLPSPLFDAVDTALAAVKLPAFARVIAYATICAWLGMLIYRQRSDQSQLNVLRTQIGELQQRLIAGEDDYAQTRALIWRNLVLSLRQLGLTLAPSLLASVPLLFVLPWLSNRFDLAAPSRSNPLAVCVEPIDALASLHWLPAQAAATSTRTGCWDVSAAENAAAPARLMQGDALELVTLPTGAHSRVIGKFSTLNLLVANPDGYLPPASTVERVTLDLPERELLAFGPAWMRGWPAPYFATLVIVSLILRWRWRLR